MGRQFSFLSDSIFIFLHSGLFFLPFLGPHLRNPYQSSLFLLVNFQVIVVFSFPSNSINFCFFSVTPVFFFFFLFLRNCFFICHSYDGNNKPCGRIFSCILRQTSQVTNFFLENNF